MLLPRGDEYIIAVQNPRTAFSDAELQGGTPEVDQFGIPKPYSGGFTATFHVLNRSRDWAVRCFTRAISDLQQRYAAIDRFLERNTERFLVETFYLSQGIRISGQWYPIIKMQWVKGETLNSFIEKNIGNAGRIKKLLPEFLDLVRRLQHLKIAHGDLQHGNIIVKDGELFLIDYDGLFLPKLARLQTNEIGHVNYQHPGRNASHYGPSIDRFSSIVIYLGLKGISEAPRLWSKYDDSENILLRAGDFINPAGSALLRELSSLPALSSDVEKFQGVCKLPFDELPDLDTFISGNFRYPEGAVSRPAAPSAPPRVEARVPIHQAAAPAVAPKPAPREQTAPLDGGNIDVLRRHVGQRVEVVGGVSQFHDSRKGRKPYMLLNFGAYPDHTFTLVLRSSALKAFQRSGSDPQGLVGKRIKVSGVLQSYKGTPQMEVDGPAHIQVLGGGVLVQQPPVAVATATRSHQQASGGMPESVFDQLYAGRTSSSGHAASVTHAPAPRPAQPAPAHAPTRSQPRPRPAHIPRVGRARRKAGHIWAGILAVVLLAALGWAIWGIWGYMYAQ
jgi:serine/threonine protein kinase